MILVESVYSPFANTAGNRQENSHYFTFRWFLRKGINEVFVQKKIIQDVSKLECCRGTREALACKWGLNFKVMIDCVADLFLIKILDVSPRWDLVNFLDITFLSAVPSLIYLGHALSLFATNAFLEQ